MEGWRKINSLRFVGRKKGCCLSLAAIMSGMHGKWWPKKGPLLFSRFALPAFFPVLHSLSFLSSPRLFPSRNNPFRTFPPSSAPSSGLAFLFSYYPPSHSYRKTIKLASNYGWSDGATIPAAPKLCALSFSRFPPCYSRAESSFFPLLFLIFLCCFCQNWCWSWSDYSRKTKAALSLTTIIAGNWEGRTRSDRG